MTAINKIRTIHARGNAAINDANILYLNEDKKKTRKWFQVCGISVPLEGTKFGLIRSIAYVPPKRKASLRDSSEGLTKEEARAQAQAYTAMKAENAYYKERWEWWKNQTRKTKAATVRKADTDRYARYLVNLHDAKEAENSQYFNP